MPVELLGARFLFFVLSPWRYLDGWLAHCDLRCKASGVRAVLHKWLRVDCFLDFLSNQSIESFHALALLYHFARCQAITRFKQLSTSLFELF